MESNLVRPLSLKARAAVAAPQQDPNGCLPDVQRSRLEQAFADFYNCLFDQACAAHDEQRHAHYLRLLREARARERAIVDSVCADAGMWTPLDEASAVRRLNDAVLRRCETLPMEADEQTLLASVLERHLVAARHGTPRSNDKTRAASGPRTGAMRGPSPSQAGGEHADVARVVARLRAGGLQLPEFDEPGASAIRADMQTSPPAAAGGSKPTRPIVLATLLLCLVCLLGLSPLHDELFDFVSNATARKSVPQRESGQAERDAYREHAPTEQAGPAGPASEPPAPPAAVVPAPEAVSPVDIAEATEVAAEAVTAAADQRLGIQVQYLLRRGDAALDRLQLTEPYADSAAANFAAVLAIDPENAAARQGLEQIMDAYATLARDALARGNVTYARDLLARAQSVGPATAALERLEREIDGNEPARR